jgi:hypothetical protein
MVACAPLAQIANDHLPFGLWLQTRRGALGLLAGVAALVSSASPSKAAYGESANVFGKVTNKTGGLSSPGFSCIQDIYP